jgi:ectoine hydroxylase-related dioxygenase (phytanoyl-CoA dioxygenase family)
MKNYQTDKNALDVPWIESPFFHSLLENSDYTEEQKEMCKFFHDNGYVVIDLNLKEEEIQDIVDDVYHALKIENTTYHADYYQYTESKRIFEHWKKSDNIANLTLNKKITDSLHILYGKEPIPFSTINFIKGSNQPLHSDTIHFHTIPNLWMCGVWVAFEDVDETNGSLTIVPGSHRWPVYDYDNLKLPHPDTIENGTEVNYREYEKFIKDLVKEKNADTHIVRIKKNQALIWAANMLHGGTNIEGVTDLSKTRLTQANHYFFGGCQNYYHPMFSEKHKGIYAKKWCDDNTNIKTYLENKNI